MSGTCNDATISATILSWTEDFHRCIPFEMQRFCNDFHVPRNVPKMWELCCHFTLLFPY